MAPSADSACTLVSGLALTFHVWQCHLELWPSPTSALYHRSCAAGELSDSYVSLLLYAFSRRLWPGGAVPLPRQRGAQLVLASQRLPHHLGA